MQEALIMKIFWHCYGLQCADRQLIIFCEILKYIDQWVCHYKRTDINIIILLMYVFQF